MAQRAGSSQRPPDPRPGMFELRSAGGGVGAEEDGGASGAARRGSTGPLRVGRRCAGSDGLGSCRVRHSRRTRFQNRLRRSARLRHRPTAARVTGGSGPKGRVRSEAERLWHKRGDPGQAHPSVAPAGELLAQPWQRACDRRLATLRWGQRDPPHQPGDAAVRRSALPSASHVRRLGGDVRLGRSFITRHQSGPAPCPRTRSRSEPRKSRSSKGSATWMGLAWVPGVD